ncbi:PadR family transcriptional regulator [Clostridium sp. AWRP]|uniref:PadR family transcriptional regulator n=1 Tax=Clostridium sp. AWRP TaxID=2212991 RepID=UPI000FDBF6BB|nr:PadR family transcriptional regulator [Clostridium sp. AWRP]AZV58374.1 PadR family transcriptional regulator [Clostridium sp. AWRP]
MINELFILGELMEEPQSGYDLRNGLQIFLGRHRKISYGVLYPLLEKLRNEGFLEMTNVESNGKTKKIASITKKGEKRFFELMKMPVPDGAHSADLYLIKLNVMQHLSLNEQMQLLDKFYQEQKDIIQDARQALNKLAKENSRDHWYASKKFQLLLNQADVTIEWINKFKKELKKGR